MDYKKRQQSTRPPVTLAEKLAAQQNKQDQPMQCERCGSTFFYQLPVFQYAQPTGYVSVEFRQLTMSPIPIRVCLCGQVVPPSNNIGTPTERAAFQASMKFAAEFADKSDPNALAQVVASKRELDELAAKLTEIKSALETQLHDVNEQLAALKTGEPAPAPEPVVARSGAKKTTK